VLFRIDTAGKTAAEVRPVTLGELRLHERYDLQEWVLRVPTILGEELLVITSEFSGFDRTAERLDVLALDKRGVLTVVELKRSAVGTAAELQALRYAAYCSTLSFGDVVELLAVFESRRTGAAVSVADAERRIRAFVDEPDFAVITDKPRIILSAEEFPPELTATVLWLRSFGVEISCVRLRPYHVEGQLLLDSSVLIPLPEARAYQIRRETKDAAAVRARTREVVSAADFLATVPENIRPLLTQIRAWLLAQEDVVEEAFKSLITYRRRADRDWMTWLLYTRSEARIAVRPEVEVDPVVFVRRSSGGWSIVRARNASEVEQAITLLQASLRFRGALPSAAD
jgi:hypothetical protein